jgi:pantoate--beta-alanine ligase
VAERVGYGEPAEAPLAEARAALAEKGFGVGYVALVDGTTLVPLTRDAPGARLIAAAKLGSVRLIDNIGIG